jgi:hypothetical protein
MLLSSRRDYWGIIEFFLEIVEFTSELLWNSYFLFLKGYSLFFEFFLLCVVVEFELRALFYPGRRSTP